MAVLTLAEATKHKFDSAPIISIDRNVFSKIERESDIKLLQSMVDNNYYTFDMARFEISPSLIICLEFIDNYHSANIYITDSDFKLYGVTPLLYAQINLDSLSMYEADDKIVVNTKLSKIKTVLSDGEFKIIDADDPLYEPASMQCVRIFKICLNCFAYINSIDKTAIPSEVKRVKKHSKGKKNKGQVKYLSVTQYRLTGCEKRVKTSAVNYTTEEWDVRGHWRHYKSGKKVWIKPNTLKRNKKLLKNSEGRNKNSMFKIT